MKVFKLFLLLLYLNIKLYYRNLKPKIKSFWARYLRSWTNMIFIIVPQRTFQDLMDRFEFSLAVVCGILMGLGGGLIIKSVHCLIMGKSENAKMFFWLGILSLVVGIISTICLNIMIK